MTPDRLSACLSTLHWSGRSLAVLANVNERQVRRWLDGSAQVPPALDDWIEMRVRLHEANPAPDKNPQYGHRKRVLPVDLSAPE